MQPPPSPTSPSPASRPPTQPLVTTPPPVPSSSSSSSPALAGLSALQLLEHLHPADLRSLADSLPPPSSRLLRVQARRKRSPPLGPRQAQGDGSGPFAEGYPACTTVSNAVLSCFPEHNTTLVQNVWSKFIWNNNYPTFIGSTYVDIYLYNANSETITTNWTRVANDRGMIGLEPQDSWFPSLSSWTYGQNISVPYFFVITTHGASLTGGEQHQATFSVIQTAPPTTLLMASLNSASGAAAASISSVLASLSSFQSTRTSGGSTNNNGNSSLQGDKSDGSFPHWAIALLVVLGLLALFAFMIACYSVCISSRRKRNIRAWRSNTSPGSVGSRSPMIGAAEGAALMSQRGGSGLKPTNTQAVAGADFQSPASSRPGSPLSGNDLTGNYAPSTAAVAVGGLASSQGNRESTATTDSHDGPITEADAFRMAEAFRKALRKPDFPPTDPSPSSSNETEKESQTMMNNTSSSRVRDSMMAQVVNVSSQEDLEEGEGPEAKEIMNRELASEGKSMTSMDNRRTPEVHSA